MRGRKLELLNQDTFFLTDFLAFAQMRQKYINRKVYMSIIPVMISRLAALAVCFEMPAEPAAPPPSCPWICLARLRGALGEEGGNAADGRAFAESSWMSSVFTES